MNKQIKSSSLLMDSVPSCFFLQITALMLSRHLFAAITVGTEDYPFTLATVRIWFPHYSCSQLNLPVSFSRLNQSVFFHFLNSLPDEFADTCLKSLWNSIPIVRCFPNICSNSREHSVSISGEHPLITQVTVKSWLGWNLITNGQNSW